MERIQKFLARSGVASRRAAEKLIEEGRVSLNGEVVLQQGVKVDPAKDKVKVDGRLIKQARAFHYYVFHKPKNCVTTMSDPQQRPTVAEYFPKRVKGLFPVGRLDYDVEGVLIVTNDGDLAYQLTHPKFEVPRTYEVKVRGNPDEKAIGRLKRRWPKAQFRRIRPQKLSSWWELTLREGKYHQVKKMWMEIGHATQKIRRTRYAQINVRGVPLGKMRELTPIEVKSLKNMGKSKSR